MKKGENPPVTAVLGNEDVNDKIYLGKCVMADMMRIGKINYNNLYYADGTAEMSDCENISIMTCNVWMVQCINLKLNALLIEIVCVKFKNMVTVGNINN